MAAVKRETAPEKNGRRQSGGLALQSWQAAWSAEETLEGCAEGPRPDVTQTALAWEAGANGRMRFARTIHDALGTAQQAAPNAIEQEALAAAALRHLKTGTRVCVGQGASSEAFLSDGGVATAAHENTGASRENMSAAAKIAAFARGNNIATISMYSSRK